MSLRVFQADFFGSVVVGFPFIFLEDFFTLVGPPVESGPGRPRRPQERKKHTNIKIIFVFRTFPWALSAPKPD